MKYMIAIIISLFLLTACAMTVSDINSQKEKFVGKEISVSGTVGDVIKIGPISGYGLKDETGKDGIGVLSQTLPKKGDKITVKGVWMKDTLLGYYLKAE